MLILGLDISSSIIGWCLLDKSGKLIDYGYIDFRKLKTTDLMVKLDYFIEAFSDILEQYQDKIEVVAVEAAAQKFSSGRSTAHTLSTLIMFNFGVSYQIYKKLGIKPELIPVSTARRLCNIKVPKGLKDKQKKEHIRSSIALKYPSIIWEKKKTGTYKDYCYDIADSLVIGEAVRMKVVEGHE